MANVKKKAKENIEKKEKDEEEEVESSKNKKNSKYKFDLWEVIVIMIITTLFGLFIGSFFVYKKYNNDKIQCNEVDSSVNIITSVYNDIISDYYGEVDKDKLTDYALAGMIEGLDDPYASYVNGSEATDLNEELDGSYVGVGIEITVKNSNIVVVSVKDDSPASKAGILVGDIIYSLDGKKYSHEEIDDLIKDIKGSQIGDKREIDAIRNGNNLRLTVVIENIDLSSVFGSLVVRNDKKIGYFFISTFANNTYEQFVDEYNNMLEDKLDAIVIDLRNNGGGYLTSAYSIATLFLNRNDIIYQKTDGKETLQVLNEYEKSIDIPVVLLVNGYTASSSEIFVAALKDNLNVTIVGTKTYGKGTIQKMQSLGNDRFIKYTVQEWLTPNGSKINGKGIIPDVIIPFDDKVKEDVQYNKALEIAINKIGG